MTRWLISFLVCAVAPSAFSNCKTATLDSYLTAESCIEEKADSRQLNYITGARQTLTNVYSKPLAVWTDFDWVISGKEQTVFSSGRPDSAFILLPNQSKTFQLDIGKDTPTSKQPSAFEQYALVFKNKAQVSEDLNLKKHTDMARKLDGNPSAWSEALTVFNPIRLFPIPTQFVADVKSIPASSVFRRELRCIKQNSKMIKSLQLNACLEKDMSVAIDISNKGAEPVYLICSMKTRGHPLLNNQKQPVTIDSKLSIIFSAKNDDMQSAPTPTAAG
jgi:hypothetical protein